MLEEEFVDKFFVTASSAGAGGYALSDDLLQTSQVILDSYDTFKIRRPSNIGLLFKTMDSVYDLKILNKVFLN